MYKFNEELCNRLTNGDIACKYDNGNLEMLGALLKKCAPDDFATPAGSKYYCINKKDGRYYWLFSDNDLPTIPLSDFIVKDSEDNKPFEWTDELALEFSVSPYATISPLRDGLEQFKASKQRKPLFTTEDGKQIFKEDIYFLVDTSWLLNRLMAHGNHGIYEGKRFSTEAAAREYVRLNKPMYSLNDVKKTWLEYVGVFNLEVFITKLEKLKP